MGFSTATQFGVPFTEVKNLMGCCSTLHAAGFPSMGREPMYCGVTGEPLDGSCFIGMVFYQRLRHMVVNMRTSSHTQGCFHRTTKCMHAVCIRGFPCRLERPVGGPVNQLVRRTNGFRRTEVLRVQPTEGRARQGGLRIGEPRPLLDDRYKHPSADDGTGLPDQP